VGSDRILRSDLTDQLEALSSNTKWLKSIKDQFGDAPLTAPNGNVSTTFTAAWLTSMVNLSIVDQAIERRHIEVTDQDRKDAEAAARSLFDTDQGSTWNDLPKWFRDDFVDSQSRYQALQRDLPDPTPSDAELQKVLERVQSQVCPSGNAVSHIQTATRAEADQVAAALAAGEDFATAARRSADSGTRATGGFLGCTGGQNYSQVPAAIRQAVDATPVGGVSAPVQTDLGFHIVRVTPFDVASLRPYLEYVRHQFVATPINQFLTRRLNEVKLWVDPRYGSVMRKPVRIVPPQPPKTRSQPPSSSPGS
jgi:hypothetical protein